MTEVFADVPSEGNALEIDKALDRLSTKEDKTASISPIEKKETVKPSQEGINTPKQDNVPFHKHPRWIQQQKDMKELRDKLAATEKDRSQNQPVSPPDWWKKQYGDTKESLDRYQLVTQKGGELEWIKQQVLGDIESKTQAEQQQIQQGEEYVDTQIAEMSSEGLKFEKNVLLKFMVDFQSEFGDGALLDSQGNYDFRKSLALMQKMQPAIEEPNVRKQLAVVGARGKASNQSQSKIPVLTRKALRNGNWRDAGI